MSKYLAQVSISQNTNVLTVVSTEPITDVYEGDEVNIEGQTLPFIIQAVDEGLRQFTLDRNWPIADAVTVPAVWRSNVFKLDDAANALRAMTQRISDRVRNISDFETKFGTVNLPHEDITQPDVPVKTLKQIEQDSNNALSTAQTAGGLLDGYEPRIEAAEQTLSTIESTLNNKISEAQSKVDAANAAKDWAQEFANAPVDTLGSLTNEYSGFHYHTKTIELHDQVETWHGEISTWYTSISGWDTDITNYRNEFTGYRDTIFGYMERAETAASNAEAIAGGAASDSVKLGGELPSFYATAQALNEHSHTPAELGLGTLLQDMVDLGEAMTLLETRVDTALEQVQMIAMTVGGVPKHSTIHTTDVELAAAVKQLQDQISALQASQP